VWFGRYGALNVGTVIAALIAIGAITIIYRGNREQSS
jgi:hypothetical protein